MKKFLYFLDHIEEYLLMIMMGAMAIVVIIQVIFRVIGSSLPWSEELSRYLAVWITFIGAALGVKRGAHVGVEALKVALPKGPRRILELFALICMVFLACVVVYYSIQIIHMQLRTGQKSPAMRIPMWRAYIGIPIGMCLVVIRCIQTAVNLFRGKDNEPETTVQ